jgi:hypothetical protein
MGLDYHRVGVGAVPRPANLVPRDAVEISCLAKEAALLINDYGRFLLTQLLEHGNPYKRPN